MRLISVDVFFGCEQQRLRRWSFWCESKMGSFFLKPRWPSLHKVDAKHAMISNNMQDRKFHKSYICDQITDRCCGKTVTDGPLINRAPCSWLVQHWVQREKYRKNGICISINYKEWYLRQKNSQTLIYLRFEIFVCISFLPWNVTFKRLLSAKCFLSQNSWR